MTLAELKQKVTTRLRKNIMFSKFLSLFGTDIDEKKWVFIVGCYNSGTTLLNEILASHPKISGLPDEGVMLTDQLVKPEDFNWRRMWVKCEDRMQNFLDSKHSDPKIIKRHWSHFYDLKKPVLLEKSVSNTCRIPFLDKNFQTAYFIHIIRDGYAVSDGIRRKAAIIKGNPYYGQENYPIALCAEQWVASLDKVEDCKSRLDNFLEIRYEELTENPSNTIAKILDFLGLEHFESDILNSSFSIHEKNSVIKNMNSNSWNRLTRTDIEDIEDVAMEHLRKYGYEKSKI